MKKHRFAFALILMVSVCTLTGCSSFSAQKSCKGSSASTPMMGWSSWNTFRININDALIKETTDALLANGLHEVGYNYINIDDGFFGGRDEAGKLFTNQKFPDGLRGISDYIHSKGLYAGIYSDAGDNTCGSIYDNDTLGMGVGLWGHDDQDFDLYFKEWNFDFIKIDFCGGSATGKSDKDRYTEIYEALQRTGRKDLRFNICRWQFPGTWATNMAGSWRMSTDIEPHFWKIDQIIELNLYLAQYASVGHYNDMDMLEVGRGLTVDQEKTHFGVWCIMSSPLLIGCDLRTIPASTLELIKNQEIIALNQDPLGLQARVVNRSNEYILLAKDVEELHGKTRAVAIYNKTNAPLMVKVAFDELCLLGNVAVRDLWAQQDLGLFTDSIAVEVPAHGTNVYKLWAADRKDQLVYEAEYAFMNEYNPDRFDKAHFAKNESASGGVAVKFLGNDESNWAEFRDIYVSEAGEYNLILTYFTGEQRNLQVSVNGKTAWLTDLVGTWNAPATTEIIVNLEKGTNVIRLGNPDSWGPDVDKIELVKI